MLRLYLWLSSFPLTKVGVVKARGRNSEVWREKRHLAGTHTEEPRIHLSISILSVCKRLTGERNIRNNILIWLIYCSRREVDYLGPASSAMTQL